MSTTLPSLTLTQLQTLATRCGITRSGTKALLRQRLEEQLRFHKPLSGDVRVLSIDLGLRNLAFGLLSPGTTAGRPGRPTLHGSSSPLTGSHTAPVLHAWRRVSLVPKTSPPLPATLRGVPTDDGAARMTIDDFGPAALSSLAVDVVRTQLLPLRPTHVLLERQRFRSGGGSAVLEWTVRVNTLEAMLYAVFGTLRSLGQWDGVVAGVEPKRVGPFLLDEADDPLLSGRDTVEARRTAAQNRAENKRRKIDLVGSWLADGTGVHLASPEAEDMAKVYLGRWRRQSIRKASVSDESPPQPPTKLDDLADSLLQGVAWFRWQANLDRLLRGEYTALLK